MTLLASLASMVCSLSLGNAAPAVAVVPVENLNRVEIISPIASSVESTAVVDFDFQLATDPGEAQVADSETPELADGTADNSDPASDDELLPADVVLDSEIVQSDAALADDLLPADVVLADDLLPADVVTEDEEILPADVIADDEAGVVEDAFADLEAEGFAQAEAAASTAPLKDEEVDSPPPAPAQEERSDDLSGDPSVDGEATS